jgi:hypothetical protein
MNGQTVDINTENLAPMTQKEMQAEMNMNIGAKRIFEKAQTATVEQKAQLVEMRRADMMKALAAYKQAVQFRPSYAPADRMTKSEGDALNNFWSARKAYRFAMAL